MLFEPLGHFGIVHDQTVGRIEDFHFIFFKLLVAVINTQRFNVVNHDQEFSVRDFFGIFNDFFRQKDRVKRVLQNDVVKLSALEKSFEFQMNEQELFKTLFRQIQIHDLKAFLGQKFVNIGFGLGTSIIFCPETSQNRIQNNIFHLKLLFLCCHFQY